MSSRFRMASEITPERQDWGIYHRLSHPPFAAVPLTRAVRLFAGPLSTDHSLPAVGWGLGP